MKKNDLEVEKSFIDYLVKTIKDKNLSSLEVTRTSADKHRLKIKINNTFSSAHTQERKTLKVNNNSIQSEKNIVTLNIHDTSRRDPECQGKQISHIDTSTNTYVCIL